MKNLEEFVTNMNEGQSEFNPSLNSHKKAYNSFISWYDKYIGKTMDKEEMLDMLKFIVSEIESDSLDVIK